MPAQLVWVRTGMFVALGVAIAAIAGCKPPPPTPTFPVTGKVIYQKKPLTVGMVTFTPDGSKGNQSKEGASGAIAADGTYSLTTGDGRQGAPLGWYKVSVTMTPPPPGSSEPAPKPAGKAPSIPSKFQKPDTSGISIEVKENASPGAYDLELK